MPLLTIHHKTEYRYARPVGFGEHRIMLRPRDGHDLRVLSEKLEISPKPSSLRRIHDVFGNSVAIADFRTKADLTSCSTVLSLLSTIHLTRSLSTLAMTLITTPSLTIRRNCRI